MTVVKDLGLIRAIQVGTSPPLNIKMLWYDDNIGIKFLKYYDTFLSAWVKLQPDNPGLWDDRGNYDASSNLFPSTGGSGTGGAVLKGDIWTISVAGVLGGTAVTIGDTVRALTDTPGQTSSNWAIGEHGLGYIPLSNVLTDSYIFVGNASNVATPVVVSGDITINNSGVVTVTALSDYVKKADNSTVISIDSNARELYDGGGNLVIRYNNTYLQLLDHSVRISVDWDSRLLYSTSNASLDWQSRTLKGATNDVLDWSNCLQNDTSGVLSIDWTNRLLKNSSGIYTIDYENGNMTNGILTTFSWFSGVGIDTTNKLSFDWFNRRWHDNNEVISCDYQNRLLKNSSSSDVFNWETMSFVGNWTTNGDFEITDNTKGYILTDTNGSGQRYRIVITDGAFDFQLL